MRVFVAGSPTLPSFGPCRTSEIWLMSFGSDSTKCCHWKSVSGIVLSGICSVLAITIAAIALIPASNPSSVHAAKLIFQEDETPEPKEPVLAAASGDGLTAIEAFDFKGLECEMYAAEPDVGNIVAIHRDYKGLSLIHI